jgi:hypothetical protein
MEAFPFQGFSAHALGRWTTGSGIRFDGSTPSSSIIALQIVALASYVACLSIPRRSIISSILQTDGLVW